MTNHTPSSLLELLYSPRVKLGALAFISVNLFASVARYYTDIFTFLGAIPLIVYFFTVALVVLLQFSASHNRLLLVHAYITLPLVIPLAFPLHSGFFLYFSCLVVLFFNALLYHGEMWQQRKHIHSAVEYGLIVLIGGGIGIIVARLFYQHVPSPAWPLMFAVASGCLFRSKAKEPAPLPAQPSSLWNNEAIPSRAKGALAPMLRFVRTASHWLAKAKSAIIPDSFLQSIPVNYRRPLGLLAFFLALLVCGTAYRPLLPLIGTPHEYVLALYLLLYCMGAILTCFSFRNHSFYFGLSILITVIAAYLSLGRGHSPETNIMLGDIPMGVELLMLLSSILLSGSLKSPVLFATSSPYGTLAVIHNRLQGTIELMLDGTLQGAQLYEPGSHVTPISYYSRQSPCGQIMKALQEDPRSNNVAVIGLGVGSIASYGQEGQTMNFYEINPMVKKIATQMDYFTFLKETKATTNIIIGDARDTLANVPDNSIGILICDAHSGDNIPKHLLTIEAFTMYLRKLETNGIIIIDITTPKTKEIVATLSRVAEHVQLTGFVRHHFPASAATSSLAQKAGLLPKGKSVLQQEDPLVTAWIERLSYALTRVGICTDDSDVIFSSSWLVLARNKENLAAISQDARWKPLRLSPGTPLLTDESCDYMWGTGTMSVAE